LNLKNLGKREKKGRCSMARDRAPIATRPTSRSTWHRSQQTNPCSPRKRVGGLRGQEKRREKRSLTWESFPPGERGGNPPNSAEPKTRGGCYLEKGPRTTRAKKFLLAGEAWSDGVRRGGKTRGRGRGGQKSSRLKGVTKGNLSKRRPAPPEEST